MEIDAHVDGSGARRLSMAEKLAAWRSSRSSLGGAAAPSDATALSARKSLSSGRLSVVKGFGVVSAATVAPASENHDPNQPRPTTTTTPRRSLPAAGGSASPQLRLLQSQLQRTTSPVLTNVLSDSWAVLGRRNSSNSSSSSSSSSSSPAADDDSFVTAFESRPQSSDRMSSVTKICDDDASSASMQQALRDLSRLKIKARRSSGNGSVSSLSNSTAKSPAVSRAKLQEQIFALEGRLAASVAAQAAAQEAARESGERAALSEQDVQAHRFLNSLLEQQLSEAADALQSERLDNDEKSSASRRHKAEARRLAAERDEQHERAAAMIQQMTDQMAQLQAYAMERIGKLEEELLEEQSRAGALESELAAVQAAAAASAAASGAAAAAAGAGAGGRAKRGAAAAAPAPAAGSRARGARGRGKAVTSSSKDDEDEDGSDTEEEKDRDHHGRR